MSPAAPGTPPPEPAHGEVGEGAEAERFGPLQLRRVHKDDGRELIFFDDTREPA
jgi:hypothetical protein